VTAHLKLRHKERFKRLLGSWLHRHQTQRWHQYVQSQPLLKQASQENPHLLSKIYRPYISTSLNCKGRVDALINHYDTLQHLGLTDLTGLASQSMLVLHEGLSKSGHLYQIALTAVHSGHREGELCLHLFFQNECLYVLNFSLVSHHGATNQTLFTRIIVGRLQGAASPQAKELVRLATREFYACRPSMLLLHAVRNIGCVLGCADLLLVSNRQRVTLNPWRRYKIQANYNQTWLEAGAVQQDNSYFQLAPVGSPEIDLEQIASKKRSEAKKKSALLNAVFESLKQKLTELQKEEKH
jgi:uncharacterized protein